jgi:hypothetical protein
MTFFDQNKIAQKAIFERILETTRRKNEKK